MAEDVFISWSGETAKKLGEILKDCLPVCLQCLKPFLSANDIEKGSLWQNELFEKLETFRLAILCITEENKNAPWIAFEAGALWKGLKGHL